MHRIIPPRQSDSAAQLPAAVSTKPHSPKVTRTPNIHMHKLTARAERLIRRNKLITLLLGLIMAGPPQVLTAEPQAKARGRPWHRLCSDPLISPHQGHIGSHKGWGQAQPRDCDRDEPPSRRRTRGKSQTFDNRMASRPRFMMCAKAGIPKRRRPPTACRVWGGVAGDQWAGGSVRLGRLITR